LPANYRLRVNLTRILGGSADLASPFAAGACGRQVSSAVPHHTTIPAVSHSPITVTTTVRCRGFTSHSTAG